MPAKNSGIERENRIRPLCDGVRTSQQIAESLGESAKYVQRVMKKYNLPRVCRGAQRGWNNPSFVSGRKIDRDGYVLVAAPISHPYARMRLDRNSGLILEHRLIVEQSLGRILLPSETVDHIDGLRLHNHPSNLRLFDSNSNHLRATITGQVPKWSVEGFEKMRIAPSLRATLQRVDTYGKMKKSGDARLRQILLAALQFGIDSPFLLGTHHHLKKAGIVEFDCSSLERALAELYQRYA